MTQILRQSTQVVVRIGPFVDVGDGFTPETGVTLSGADEAELLKAAGAATVDISGSTWAAITGADGWYDLTLSTTDTNTLGTLDVVVNDDSVCLPVFRSFQVIEEAAFDAIYAASASPATAANLATVAGYLDTEIAAILALLDDPRTEPGQGAPPVNPDLATKIDYLYKHWRNKKTQTSTEFSLYADDAATVDQKSTVSDDGTTATRGEMATGA